MVQRSYTASLSRSQGRAGYSVIFRHPARLDRSTGKIGLRVRRGLGTQDKEEAERLRSELNDLLGDPTFHAPAAREEAARRFDAQVVDIFFDRMVREEFDFPALRDRAVPLPPSGEPDGYRHVLLLGTTGAGKTTLVRQIIGTDLSRERFPSTSTAKTTIHDTEIILDHDGPWRAVATFVSSDEVREYLSECISEAVRAAARGADDATVLQRLLNHVNQRFRFSYVLGTGPKLTPNLPDFDDEDEEEEVVTDAGFALEEEVGESDLSVINELLGRVVTQLRTLARRLRDEMRTDLGASSEGDEAVVEELFEEELDNQLRGDETFHRIADELMDEIERRFELLPPGQVTRTRQGWPLTWQGEWPSEERVEFVKSISWLSSNYAPLFGRLLTPLVNGVRVAGPFAPSWANGCTPRLVLLDGEGLGHAPSSSSSVSTALSRRIDSADAVLLVDNATQPMQAAPQSAMREVVATGNGRKLILAFTHFDEVKGDNLRGDSEKAVHVLASANNVLAAFGEALGPQAERILRRRIEQARFFLAELQNPLSENSSAGRRTIRQLRRLLESIDQVIDRPQPTEAQPVYNRMNLVLVIRTAADSFHKRWRPRLGLESRPGFSKEHWTRVKALSRRLAENWTDEYDTLKPVADLRQELVEGTYRFIQNPESWDGAEPSEEEEQDKFDRLADSLGRRFLDLSTHCIWKERMEAWQRAYSRCGTGSTFVRAEIIGDEIYERAAPIPEAIPSPDRNRFLREVVSAFEAAAEEVGARFQ